MKCEVFSLIVHGLVINSESNKHARIKNKESGRICLYIYIYIINQLHVSVASMTVLSVLNKNTDKI